jgi:hypothetical protein|uniref:Uncharacterized protein n=1 Tax=Zea mays TaxID=4577 RepID=C4J363_MAIZE|nr:unknown [Zea mays]
MVDDVRLFYQIGQGKQTLQKALEVTPASYMPAGTSNHM